MNPARRPVPADGDPADDRPSPWAPGFATQERQVQDVALEVEGSLPDWLEGTLVRNGPAKFEAGDRELEHWFDGFAMLHAFSIDGGEVTYSNRFLESEVYTASTVQGDLAVGQFATDPCNSVFDRLFTLFSRDTSGNDNANVHVAELAGEFVAMTETPMPVRFDPDTLEARGRLDLDDDLDGDLTTAHPHHDPDRGETVNYHTRVGRTSTYRVQALPDGERARRTVAEVTTRRPAYMHSFALTPRYVVLSEFPLDVHPLRLALSGDPFVERFRWRPERGTRWIVVDRGTGEVVADPRGEALFAFHHVNAYEEEGVIVADLCAYPDASVLDEQYLDPIRGPEPPSPDAVPRLVRARIPLDGGEVTTRRVVDEPLELPRTHDRAVNGRPYRHVYGIGNRQDPPQEFHNQIVKVDVRDETARTWSEPGTYPGEPVFVAEPEGDAEDDGLLLSVVFEAEADTSFLLALDASSLEEVARAETPHRIPFGFHGSFFGGT